uniref:RNA-directed DNA polymerase n=1 Tax=Bracon brevicornis TaxID=1563983 RepID=A0A6V7JID3_9HYME
MSKSSTLHRALHHVPDALSRIPEGHLPEEALNAMKVEDYWTTTDDQWYRKRRADVLHRPAQLSDWRVENNHLYFHRQNKLYDGELPDLDAWKLVVPRELRQRILEECHSAPQAGHPGLDKTYHRSAQSCYWPKMSRDVLTFNQCDRCQNTKADQIKPAAMMGPRRLAGP